MDDAQVEELLRSSTGLLYTALTELRVFYETWREAYPDLSENYSAYRDLTKQLNNEIYLAVRETKSFRDFQDPADTAKALLDVSRKMEHIATSPLVIIQASRNVAALCEQVAKLMRVSAPSHADAESELLDNLTPGQLAQIYEWLATNGH